MIRICRAGCLFPVLLMFLVPRVAAQQSADTARLDTVVADTVVVGQVTAPPGSGSLDTSSVAGVGDNADADSAALRSVPDSVVGGWKKSSRFVYANDPAYWRHAQPVTDDSTDRIDQFVKSDVFRYFLYILLAGIVLFVIIRIMSDNNFGIFYRRRIVKAAGDGAAAGEPEGEEDLDVCLEQALAKGDYRRATRYLYLRTLRLLGERGLIRVTPEATNHEYLRQLAGGPREAAFRLLTLAYEKVWYGDVLPGEGQFRRLHQHFVEFDKAVQL